MSDQNWTPYREKMIEELKPLALTAITQIDGIDIAPAMNLNTAETSGSCTAYSTDKIEKVAIGSFTVKDDLQCGLCTIIPQTDSDLPMFVSRWEEKKSEIILLVDIIPTVDTLVDEEYRVKYVEPLNELWQKYASLPGICPEENDALRGLCSIIYTAARVPIEKDGMRLAALAPQTTYLNRYVEYIGKASSVADDQKIKEISRKILSVRTVFGDFFSKCAGEMIGNDSAELLRTVFF